MNQNNDDLLRQRVAELEAENERLRRSLDMVKAERKELREELYGPYPEGPSISEEELIEFMKNRVPGEGMKFFADLGLLPRKSP
jgi:hypothetical protein